MPRVPRDLETICLKCLQKEPKKRYESAQDLADDLDRYRGGNPIKARRTPVWERGCKWSKRRPGQATAVAAGLLFFIGLIAGSIVYLEWNNNQLVQKQNHGVNLLARADRANIWASLNEWNSSCPKFLNDVTDEPKLEPISLQVNERRRRVGDQLHLCESTRLKQRAIKPPRNAISRIGAGFRSSWSSGRTPSCTRRSPGCCTPRTTSRSSALRPMQALAIYAQDPRAAEDAWGLVEPLPTALSDAEKSRVRDGCYDLLLILSQAADPAKGLRILDRAARLRPEPTAAYHLRRAECLERAGDSRAGTARIEKPQTQRRRPRWTTS